MLELIKSYTSLPNLHPAVIHYPVAFLTMAVLIDISSVIFGRVAWLDRTAVWLI